MPLARPSPLTGTTEARSFDTHGNPALHGHNVDNIEKLNAAGGRRAQLVVALRVLVRSSCSSATMLTGLISSFLMLFVLRLMLGLGESAGFPCVSKLLASVVPVSGLGRANGIVACAYLMAPGVGVWGAGQLMDYVGWRGTSCGFGRVAALVAAAVVLP